MPCDAPRVLILGGTAEARALANALDEQGGFDIVTSLAGRTAAPLLPPGEVRTGGFGGADGLANFIAGEHFDLVADATHPFAAAISRNAYLACAKTGTALLRLERPAWTAQDGDDWRMVADVPAAAAALTDRDHAFVTVGRQELSPFFARATVRITARMIEAPEWPVPENVRLVVARPPFTLDEERRAMHEQGITVLVCKNSGGEATRPKLDAARELGLPVIMVERPELPEVPSARTPAELVALIGRLLKQ